MAAAAGGGGKQVNLLVVASPDTPELAVLSHLPPSVKVVATGQTLADLSKQLSDEQWASIDVMLNCGVGRFAGKRADIQVGGAVTARVAGRSGRHT
jgi:hypothetical protein